MERTKLFTSISLGITVVASASLLLLPTRNAEAATTPFACNNMGCYGANTCERHSGSSCDLDNPAVPEGCVTTNCTP